MTILRPLSKRGLATLQAAHVREQDPFDDQGVLLDMYLAFKTLAKASYLQWKGSSLILRARIGSLVEQRVGQGHHGQ